MKTWKILCLIIFMFIGCSEKQNSIDAPVVNDGTTVINPPVTVIGSTEYQVESAYFGMLSMADKQIKGIIKVKYTGSAGIRYVYATTTFYNKDNVALFKGSGYITNVTSSSDGSSNTAYFLAPQYNTGYVFFNGPLTYFGLTALEDISRIEMTVSGNPFTYQVSKGKFSVMGNPYKDKEGNWCANIMNNGDRSISTYMNYIRFLYIDSKNRLYNWSIPDNYEVIYWGDYITYSFRIGETAVFRGGNPVQYANESFTCVQVCVQWW
jgi:hypothetical protein